VREPDGGILTESSRAIDVILDRGRAVVVRR
jgi:hypothetical protein